MCHFTCTIFCPYLYHVKPIEAGNVEAVHKERSGCNAEIHLRLRVSARYATQIVAGVSRINHFV